MESKSSMRPYVMLGISLVASYIIMLFLMLSRVNALDNLYVSLNQFYMSGLMVSVMLMIMLITMSSMYNKRSMNILLVFVGTVAIALFWTLIRSQTAVGDQQFLRSMIPHHAAAILVCEQAALSNPRIQELCVEIIDTQKEEIRIMKDLME